MMNYGWGWGDMMGGAGWLAGITWLVLLIDLLLLGIWLWQNIGKK